MEIFTKRLNELIKEKGIQKQELAKAIGTSKALVTIWTQGKSYSTIVYLAKLADYFNVCADYLLGRKDYY